MAGCGRDDTYACWLDLSEQLRKQMHMWECKTLGQMKIVHINFCGTNKYTNLPNFRK